MKCTKKWLQMTTSTSKLTQPIRLARLHSFFARPSLKMRTIFLRSAQNLMLAKDKTIENEMKELRALILGEGERVGRVQDEILREKEYARDMEENVNGDLDEIRKVVFSHGAPKPDLKLMVSACLPFESLSFSKKWCPPINSGELNNIPDAIAGFSVDMAR